MAQSKASFVAKLSIVIEEVDESEFWIQFAIDEKLIDDAVTYLLRIPLTQQSKDQLKTDILLDGQANDNYWTSAWNTFVNTPSNTTNTNIVKTKLKNLYQYLMRLPEYQLA